jgi:hypothetical protein
MMNKPKTSAWAIAKIFILLPAFVLLAVACAKQEIYKSDENQLAKVRDYTIKAKTEKGFPVFLAANTRYEISSRTPEIKGYYISIEDSVGNVYEVSYNRTLVFETKRPGTFMIRFKCDKIKSDSETFVLSARPKSQNEEEYVSINPFTGGNSIEDIKKNNDANEFLNVEVGLDEASFELELSPDSNYGIFLITDEGKNTVGVHWELYDESGNILLRNAHENSNGSVSTFSGVWYHSEKKGKATLKYRNTTGNEDVKRLYINKLVRKEGSW